MSQKLTCRTCHKEFTTVEDDTMKIFFGDLVSDQPLDDECPECKTRKHDERQTYLSSLPKLTALNHVTVDTDDFESMCKRQGAEILSKTDFNSPSATGSLVKYHYRNLKNEIRWCLEYGLQYAADAFAVEIWLFDQDFNEDQARIYLRENYYKN